MADASSYATSTSFPRSPSAAAWQRAPDNSACPSRPFPESIANLEGTLRVRLLDRSPKGVEPTIYARALLNRGNVSSMSSNKGSETSSSCTDPGSGEVRIGCPENP